MLILSVATVFPSIPVAARSKEYSTRWGHGYFSLVFIVCCAGSGLWSVVQRSPTGCVCVCVCVWCLNLKTRWPRLNLGCCAKKRDSPSSRWASAAIACSKDIGIFDGRPVSINDFLHVAVAPQKKSLRKKMSAEYLNVGAVCYPWLS